MKILFLCVQLLLCFALSGLFSLKATTFSNPGPLVKKFEQLSGVKLTGITSILQDKAGFLWLSSRQGLKRFDGYAIKQYHHEADNPNSLSSDHISKMLLDDDGFIWLLSIGGGLNRFDPVTEQFLNFRYNPDDIDSLSSDVLLDISLGANNKLWLGSFHGVNLFDRKTFKNQRLTSQLTANTDNPQQIIKSILLDNKNRLWVSDIGNGVYRHDLSIKDPDKRQTHYVADGNNGNSLDANIIFVIKQTRDGNVWLGGELGLNKYNEDSDDFSHIDLSIAVSGNQQVVSLYQDIDNRVWIGTSQSGLRLLNPPADKAVAFMANGDSADTLNVSYIIDIYQDRSGSLWLSNDSTGLIKLDKTALLFDYTDINSGVKPDENSFFTDKSGQLWFTDKTHLYEFDTVAGLFKLAVKDIGNIESFNQLPDTKILLSFVDKGLMYFDPKTRQLDNYLNASQKAVLNDNGFLRIIGVDSDSIIWGGQYSGEKTMASGLFSFDKKTGVYIQHFEHFQINSLLFTNNAIVMTTIGNGIHVFDRDTRVWTPVKDPKQQIGLVFSSYLDSSGRVWLGTLNGGLVLLNVEDLTLTFYNKDNYLSTSNIYYVMEESKDVLWLVSFDKLIRFDLQSKQTHEFDHNNGLRISELSAFGGGRLANGQMFMSTAGGMTRFSPDVLMGWHEQKKPNSAVLLSEFKLFNQSAVLTAQDPKSRFTSRINNMDELALSYKDQLFSISFGTSYFAQLNNISYAYQMKGFSDQWIETDAGALVATFTGLPANDYLLNIRTSQADGGWSDEYRSLKISISPPIWATTAAYVGYVIVLIGLFWLLSFVRTRQLRLRATELEQGIEQRTVELQKRADTISRLLDDKAKLFANVSHEFRTPLTLILNPVESWLKRDLNEDDHKTLSMVRRNGIRLLSMVDKLLVFASVDASSTQKNELHDLAQTLDMLATSFQPLFDSKNIDFDMPTFDSVLVKSKADSLELILTNLITNAIKYTPANGKIWIKVHQPQTVRKEHAQVSISVSDTGIGISEENQAIVFDRFTRATELHGESIPGAGIGLALVKELVQSSQGSISLSSEVGKGSEFVVMLPVQTQTDGQTVGKESMIASSSQLEVEALSLVPVTTALTQAQIADLMPEHDENSIRSTILLIDDNADMLTLLTSTLSGEFDCITAINGELGLELGLKYIPDIIICDVMMPGLSGFEVAQRFKSMELCCHIPLLLLTAKSDKDSRMTGWQHNIDEYLTKPFDADELIARVRNLLSIRSLLKSRYTQSLFETDSKPQSDAGLSEQDQQFVSRLKAVIAEHYADPDFTRPQLAKQLGVSDRQVCRKLQAIMDQGFSDYLRRYRLGEAAKLIKIGLRMSQVFEQVGFSSPSYFSACFKAEFGMTPTQFQVGEG